ncbi:hypothetical protein [Candidatus Methanomethylophilus sp. 1R26]|nr:hypothetical protein [Candidatus Methanomethylophilus sp. 1R26]
MPSVKQIAVPAVMAAGAFYCAAALVRLAMHLMGRFRWPGG